MTVNIPINALLSADDLAIFSLSKGLQEKLNFLEKYYLDWGSKIDSKKSKIITFHSQGALIKKV